MISANSTSLVYRFMDGKQIVCRTREEFVTWLWQGSSLGMQFSSATNLEEYMMEFAKRAFVADRHYIRTSDVNCFVDDLLTVGYLTVSSLN